MKNITRLSIFGLLSGVCFFAFQNCSKPGVQTQASTATPSSIPAEPHDAGIGGIDPIDDIVLVPDIAPGEERTVSIQTSFGQVDLRCSAYPENSQIVPNGVFIRCQGDATALLKTAYDTPYSMPASFKMGSQLLTANFVNFMTLNDDQQAYYDASCSQPKDYFMGSSRSFQSSATGVVPRCKLTDSGEIGQCVDSTECRFAPILGGVYYRNKEVGWKMVTITYENIRRQ